MYVMDVVPKRHSKNHDRISGRTGNFNYEIVFLEMVHFHKLCVFGMIVVNPTSDDQPNPAPVRGPSACGRC